MLNRYPINVSNRSLFIDHIAHRSPEIRLRIDWAGHLLYTSRMPQSQWTKIGKVKDAHSLKGDLYVLVFSKDISWLKDIDCFALAAAEKENDKKIFEIERIKAFKDGVMIKPKGIDDRTQAEALKGRLFYLPEELFESDEGDTIYLKEILGFQVLDQEQKVIGKIVEFSTNTLQDLLVVEMSSGKKVEIPFVDDFILELNFDEKTLQMDLPEGLLDL
jgi:16S rRNA processing protein RimM